MLVNILKIFIDVLFPIFAVIAFAAYTDRFFHLDTKLLSKINIYILCPLLILLSLENIELQGQEFWMIVAMAISSTVILVLIGIGLSTLLKLDRKLSGAFIMCVFMGNTGGIGFSLAHFAFGDSGFHRAVLFFAIVAVINGPIAIFLSSRSTQTVKQSLVNIIKNPLIYATILGLMLNLLDWHLPLPLERFAEIPAKASVPFTLIMLGVQLARIKMGGKLKPLVVASLTRLIIAPLVGLGIAFLIGVSDLSMKISVIQIAMPAATFVAVFATEFGSDAEFATSVSLVTTIASIVSLTALMLYFA